MPYQRFYFHKGVTTSPRCSKISGQVTQSGTPQASAIVDLIDEQTQTLIGEKTTDGSGNYSFDSGYPILDSHTYHVTAKYDSGTQKYNSLSQPYVTPASNG